MNADALRVQSNLAIDNYFKMWGDFDATFTGYKLQVQNLDRTEIVTMAMALRRLGEEGGHADPKKTESLRIKLSDLLETLEETATTCGDSDFYDAVRDLRNAYRGFVCACHQPRQDFWLDQIDTIPKDE